MRPTKRSRIERARLEAIDTAAKLGHELGTFSYDPLRSYVILDTVKIARCKKCGREAYIQTLHGKRLRQWGEIKAVMGRAIGEACGPVEIRAVMEFENLHLELPHTNTPEEPVVVRHRFKSEFFSTLGAAIYSGKLIGPTSNYYELTDMELNWLQNLEGATKDASQLSQPERREGNPPPS